MLENLSHYLNHFPIHLYTRPPLQILIFTSSFFQVENLELCDAQSHEKEEEKTEKQRPHGADTTYFIFEAQVFAFQNERIATLENHVLSIPNKVKHKHQMKQTQKVKTNKTEVKKYLKCTQRVVFCTWWSFGLTHVSLPSQTKVSEAGALGRLL